MSTADFFLLRAPFSLHLGWIVAASAVNTSVQADAARASPSVLLSFAILSYVAVVAISTIFALAAKDADAIICLVAAWAFGGVYSELKNPADLNNPDRYNPYKWDTVTLRGLDGAALGVVIVSLVLALLAIMRRTGIGAKCTALTARPH
jgi:hypothetical protein